MIPFLLNLPYTLAGIVLAILLQPTEVSWGTNPYRIVFRVKRESLAFGYMKGWRGLTAGHVIVLNQREEENDLHHEIIHVEQHARRPLIFPIFYYYEFFRHGYRNNKYEDEAYRLSGSIYRAGKVREE